jgi:antitoxin component YwqK of YwqJK toxin-antitoxin module
LEEEALFKNGKPVGETKTYHENGELKKRMVYNKKGQSTQSEIFDDLGNLLQQSSYQEGLLHGEIKTYYSSGQLKEKIPYKYGQLDGTYISHNEVGEIHLERTYQSGRVMREKIHNNPQSKND